jgi:hypothetical protein
MGDLKMENTFQLSVDQNAVFSGIGTQFAMAEVDADQAIIDFAKAVQPNAKEPASYDIWTAGIEIVKQSYASKKNVAMDSDTVKSMTKRFYARLNEKFGLTKPASGSADSVKKAEQRAKAELAKAELLAKPTAELQAEIAMLTASPTKANLAKAGKLAGIVEDQRAEKLKDVLADLKDKQAEVGKLAKKCGDRDILEQCIELLAANITESTM